MDFKVIGKYIRKGEFEGRPWQKIYLSVEHLSPNANKYVNLEGAVVETISCPYNEEFSKIRIGQEVTFLYDKYGKVKSFQKGV